MEAERWKRVRQLFDEAVELEPEEREVFLARGCAGDPGLLDEVQSLLLHDGSFDGLREAVLESCRNIGTALEAGDRLGPYEIANVIGVGGMGEVYRAHDSALQRDVAIKVLPPAAARDPERLARFRREAKALGSLSHPNIASIFGLETSGGTPALVLELVTGETLADVLARGPLSLARALPLAKQIAEALDAAHQRGVVHRDLKPANVSLTKDGIVKVLDFGLAKLFVEPSPETPSASPDPTADTRRGVVLGTAAYMSPEQARGETVDKRTDIWAFGAVVYEMLTGRAPFRGGSVSETLAAVLRDEVDWSSVPSETPPSIVKLLARCLERDPRRRLRDMGDAWAEIDEAMQTASGASVRDAEERRHAGRRALPILATAAAVLLAGLTGWHVATRGPNTSVPPSRFAISLPEGVSVARVADHPVGSTVALSPDGRTIAFTAVRNGSSQIYLRPLDRLTATPLLGSEGGHTPFFSPDGSWVGFLGGTSVSGPPTLKKVPAEGGEPVVIAEGYFEGASWGADDRIVLGSRRGLQVVPASGGEPRSLIANPELEWHRGPQVLPGGRAVLFYVWAGTPEASRIEVVSTGTGRRRELLRGTSPKLAPGGRLVFARAGSLWAVPFDAGEATLAGAPLRVLDALDVSLGGFAAYDVSADGSLLYAPAEGARQRTLVWVDGSGEETPIDAPARDYESPRISPDGTRVAVGIGQVDSDIWVYDLSRSVLTRFTVDPTSDSDAEWSPDGSRIAFHSHRDDGGNVYVRAADGTSGLLRLTSGPGEKLVTTWAPDGRSVVFTESQRGPGWALFRLPLDGSGPSELLRTSSTLSEAVLSPDGRFLAYVSDESGAMEVYVRPYPDVERSRWQVSSGGGRAPVWSRDGRHIFFRRGDEMRRARVDSGAAFSVGKPETLFAGRYIEGRATIRSYDLAPDGRFLMLKDATPDPGDPSRSELVLVGNWAGELARLFR